VVFSLRQRVIRPEFLDDAPEPEALRSLQDLVRINCRFGGHGVLARMISSVARPAEEFTFLDVGAATGDSVRVVSNNYPRAGVIALDRDFFHVRNGLGQRVCGDGFRLPFRDRAVDFVFCSLFLHHFPDEEIVELLREAARVARRAVLLSDLERRLLPYLFLPATRWLFGWRHLTVHDGPISVAAGFRRGELLRLAKEAGLVQAREQVHWPAFRISLIAQVPGQNAAGPS
jgi:SAM-dependent methyltransferase